MKTLLIAVALLLMAGTAGTAGAEEKYNVDISKSDKWGLYVVTPHVDVSLSNEQFLEIKTKTNTIRVYPCGKVEKLTWKEINPNEEPETLTFTAPTMSMEDLTFCVDTHGRSVPCR